MPIPKIDPYVVVASGKESHDIFKYVNNAVYHSHGPDWRARKDAISAVEVDPLFEYERLLKVLCSNERLEILPYRELFSRSSPTGRSITVIRHDIDIDIVTALEIAKLEAKYGIQTTYFILHTAPYYGEFDRNHRFLRYESMATLYLELQSLGHEVALHTDPLFIYQEHKRDGAEGLLAELKWLRSIGLNISGSAAHNSHLAYGAVNYAIFKGRPRILIEEAKNCPGEIYHEGKWAPLGVLNEAELGLSYEANDIYWQKDVNLESATLMGVNKWWWNYESNGNRRQALKEGTCKKGRYRTTDDILPHILEYPAGKYLELSIHPVYYGCRADSEKGPRRVYERKNGSINHTLGWVTRIPMTIQGRTVKSKLNTLEHQSLVFANELGMLDRHIEDVQPQNTRVLVLGGANLDGDCLMRPSQFQSQLAERLTNQTDNKFNIRKLTYPLMGFTRLFGWYLAVKESYQPDIVMLGVGADLLIVNTPKLWSKLTGYSASYPPGDYVYLDNNDSVQIRKRSDLALLFKGHVNTIDLGRYYLKGNEKGIHPANLILLQEIKKALTYVVRKLREENVRVLLIVEECGEAIGLWSGTNTHSEKSEIILEFDTWIREFTYDLSVEVINPYLLMKESSVITHWQSIGEWNAIGHSIAAEVAAKALKCTSAD